MHKPNESPPIPTEIKLHQKSKMLEVAFSDGAQFKFSCEFLRVYSPSAEVQGHGPGQEVLQLGKEEVNIDKLEPVGNYAVKPIFSDGHATGLFSWVLLYRMGLEQEEMWNDYLKKLQEVGYQRKTKTPQEPLIN